MALLLVAAACTQPAPSSPSAVTVTASSATITYGDAIPTIVAFYAGLPAGATETEVPATCSTTATSTSPPGIYPTFCEGASQGGLTIVYLEGTVTILPAPVVVQASSGSMTYGGTVPTITASYSGLVGGDTEPDVLASCSTAATPTSDAGSYPSSCSGASDPNYEFTYADGNVEVGAAPVSVTASSGSAPYGSPPPAITASYSGLVNGDTEPATAATCSTTATATSPVGSYPSSCSGAADTNYSFTYVDGSVSVTAVSLVITASSDVVGFGEPIPPVTPSYSGLAAGDVAPATPPTCSTSATAGSPAGTYPTTCSGASDPNYSISYVDGSVTITAAPAEVVVTASSATVTYGEAVPTITASYVGLTGGQTEPATPATCTTTATAGSPAGTYPTTCSGAADPNHTFTYVDGTVTVLAKDATITASSASSTYGDAVPAVEPTYSGLVNGDTAAATPPTCSTTASSTSPAGSYESSCSGAADPNYVFGYVPGTVTIAKAGVTVTASSATMDEGGTVPTITPSYDGFRLGQTDPATPPTCSTTATPSSPPGSYASSCSGADDPNHSFTYVDGTVTVLAPPPVGYAEYTPGVDTTTVTAAATLPTGTLAVADASAFDTYVNLTVETTTGPTGVFCKGTTATTFTGCQLGTGSVPVGAFVSSAAPVQFDVYTIVPGGAGAVEPSSLTIVQDVDAANRGVPSGISGDAANGLVTYVQSADPTGSFPLTFGWCDPGTPAWSGSDPACHTGEIVFAPGTASQMGDQVSVSFITSNVYQKVHTAVIGPDSVPSGSTVTAFAAAGAAAIPRLQDTGSVGDATVVYGSRFTAIVPIPAGMSYVGAELMGGDALTSGNAVLTYCPTFASPGCTASTGTNYAATTTPFVQLSLPSAITVPGGSSVTMPTIALTLEATGTPGTTVEFSLTEFQTRLRVNIPLLGLQNVDFFGYPTTGDNTDVVPPVAPPTVLASVDIT